MPEIIEHETATLGGGCFWCLEAVFEQLEGVFGVVSGYTGGETPDPSYAAVCEGDTGHAEVVQITFDPAIISFADLLDVFFATHDPTTLNRQGNDVGTQYRSAIFYHDAEQKQVAEVKVSEWIANGVYSAPIVTQIEPLQQFHKAEAYHQGYFRGNPGQSYCQYVVAPKVAKVRKSFAHRLKS